MTAEARINRTEQALDTLGTLATSPNLRVVAVATTGLKGVPVEVVVLGPDGGILFQSFVAADRPIEPDASRINGVKDEDLKDAVSARQMVSVLQLTLLTPDTLIVAYTPQFIYEAFTRAGADIDAAQVWENGQALVAPMHGAWNETRQDYSFVALGAVLRETAIDESGMAPSGTALGNAQRLYALIRWHGTAPRYGLLPSNDLDGEFCPACDQPFEHWRC